MIRHWTVVTEISLISEVRRRGRESERELFALQELSREEGPDALGLDASYLAGIAAWDQLAAPCAPDLFVELAGRMLWVELEILPGRTIIFRRGRVE